MTASLRQMTGSVKPQTPPDGGGGDLGDTSTTAKTTTDAAGDGSGETTTAAAEASSQWNEQQAAQLAMLFDSTSEMESKIRMLQNQSKKIEAHAEFQEQQQVQRDQAQDELQ